MFKKLIIAIIICLLPALLFSQEVTKKRVGSIGQELGIGIGISNVLGELGGSNDKKGRPFFYDLDGYATRPVIALVYRYNLNGYVVFRGGLSYGLLRGDDKWTKPTEKYSYGWFRSFRNLHFRSPIIELSAGVEYNIFRYEIGRKRYRFSPYLLGGLAVFYFNPKARLSSPDGKGDWQALQPLGTEGQYLDEYPDRKPYKRIQPALLLGGGLKYNITNEWGLSIGFGQRFTFTDYLDDVSKTYPDPQYLNASDPTGTTAALSRRSPESPLYLDTDSPLYPNKNDEIITAPGQQRGDPSKHDSYFFAGVVTLTYTVQQGKLHCPKF